MDRKRSECRSEGAVGMSGMFRSDEYEGGALAEGLGACWWVEERCVRVFMRLVLSMRLNWSVRSLAHVSESPLGGLRCLRRLGWLRSAIVCLAGGCGQRCAGGGSARYKCADGGDGAR